MMPESLGCEDGDGVRAIRSKTSAHLDIYPSAKRTDIEQQDISTSPHCTLANSFEDNIFKMMNPNLMLVAFAALAIGLPVNEWANNAGESEESPIQFRGFQNPLSEESLMLTLLCAILQRGV